MLENEGDFVLTNFYAGPNVRAIIPDFQIGDMWQIADKLKPCLDHMIVCVSEEFFNEIPSNIRNPISRP